MVALADFIARHAVPVLLFIVVVLLATSLLLWRLLERYGPRLWSGATGVWDAVRCSRLIVRLRAVPGLREMLTPALTAPRYLGLHAVFSFAIAFALLAAFVELADEIGLDEGIGQFDVALAAAMATHLSHATLTAIAWVTYLGNKEFLIALVAVLTVVLLVQRRTLLAAWWVVATASGSLLNVLLKSHFERIRPPHEHGVVVETSWSFPSGHASGSMLIYGLLGYVLIRYLVPRAHLVIALLCLTLIVFVGFSRVLLHVHYLSDVLAGYVSAAAWGLLCIAGAEAIRRHATPPVD